MTETPGKYEVELLGETPNHLIALALEKQADPNTLSKLMDLQERWEAGKARKAFVAAMTAFKQEAPAVLKKGDTVDFTTQKGRTHYNYANLGSIVQEITAILGKHELSASWGTAQDGNNVTVTCHVTHIAGHRESVTLTGPIDESGNKNRIQAVGSTVTYLQRYTLLAALGLATGEDDDGRGGAEAGSPPAGTQKSQKENGKPSPQGQGEIKSASGQVENVIEKASSTGGKTRWLIFINKVAYATFSSTDRDNANHAKELCVNVEIEYKDTKFGPNVTSLKVVEGPEPGSEEQ